MIVDEPDKVLFDAFEDDDCMDWADDKFPTEKEIYDAIASLGVDPSEFDESESVAELVAIGVRFPDIENEFSIHE